MQTLVGDRLPEITPDISEFITGSLDFVGINHYTSLYAKNDRTGIRKFILRDASTDAAVITSSKIRISIYFLFGIKRVEIELIDDCSCVM